MVPWKRQVCAKVCAKCGCKPAMVEQTAAACQSGVHVQLAVAAIHKCYELNYEVRGGWNKQIRQITAWIHGLAWLWNFPQDPRSWSWNVWQHCWKTVQLCLRKALLWCQNFVLNVDLLACGRLWTRIMVMIEALFLVRLRSCWSFGYVGAKRFNDLFGCPSMLPKPMLLAVQKCTLVPFRWRPTSKDFCRNQPKKSGLPTKKQILWFNIFTLHKN